MSDFTPVSLIAQGRTQSQSIETQDQNLFPFDAFEFDDPNTTDSPVLSMKAPWSLGTSSIIQGDLDKYSDYLEKTMIEQKVNQAENEWSLSQITIGQNEIDIRVTSVEEETESNAEAYITLDAQVNDVVTGLPSANIKIGVNVDSIETLDQTKRQVYTSTPTVPYSVGDIWIKSDDSTIYNSTVDRTTTYTESDWVKSTTATDDTTANTALDSAGTALDLADEKGRVFIVTPSGPYDIGDLWVKADDTGVYTAIASRDSGYLSTEWVEADSRITGHNDAFINLGVDPEGSSITMGADKILIDGEITLDNTLSVSNGEVQILGKLAVGTSTENDNFIVESDGSVTCTNITAIDGTFSGELSGAFGSIGSVKAPEDYSGSEEFLTGQTWGDVIDFITDAGFFDTVRYTCTINRSGSSYEYIAFAISGSSITVEYRIGSAATIKNTYSSSTLLFEDLTITSISAAVGIIEDLYVEKDIYCEYLFPEIIEQNGYKHFRETVNIGRMAIGSDAIFKTFTFFGTPNLPDVVNVTVTHSSGIDTGMNLVDTTGSNLDTTLTEFRVKVTPTYGTFNTYDFELHSSGNYSNVVVYVEFIYNSL